MASVAIACFAVATATLAVATATLAVATAILAALVPAAADSGVPAPLRQVAEGIEAGDVLCNAGRTLLVSPDGTPACVFVGSLEVLADRGWLEVPTGGEAGPEFEVRHDRPGQPVDGPSIQDPRPAGQYHVASSSYPPNIHHNTLTISKYPVVGEVAEMTFSVTAVRESDAFIADPPHVRPVLGIAPSPPHRVFDMISNIGTGDPNVFQAYDPDNVTMLAQPGETYTVKAKFEILEEGFARVGGRGLHSDVAQIYIAASKNTSMSMDEYDRTGQTYLDHTMVTGQEVQAPHVPDVDMGLAVPGHALNEVTLLGEYRTTFSSFGVAYIELNYTDDQIVEELFYWGYLRGDIREFFVHIMNYTEERANAVRMGDDLLASAYLASPGDALEIVDDMLTRRNYTAAEVRDFFRDHMFYTDDETAALPLNAATARTQSGVAGLQQQRAGLFTVSGRVHGQGYFSTASMPIHGIKVCAYDHDATTMRASVLRTSASLPACTFTAQSGTYYITNIRNDDPNDATSVDLVLRVSSEGGRLSITGTSGAPYIHDEPVMVDFSEPALGRDIMLSDPIGGSGRIIDAISDAREFFRGHGISKAPLAVKWQHQLTHE